MADANDHGPNGGTGDLPLWLWGGGWSNRIPTRRWFVQTREGSNRVAEKWKFGGKMRASDNHCGLDQHSLSDHKQLVGGNGSGSAGLAEPRQRSYVKKIRRESPARRVPKLSDRRRSVKLKLKTCGWLEDFDAGGRAVQL